MHANHPAKLFYILAASGTGKSWCATACRTPLILLDQDGLLSKWIRSGEMKASDSQETKAAKLLEYLSASEQSACMLASLTPESINGHPHVHFCAVLPGRPVHYFYLLKRYLIHLAHPRRAGKPDWYRWSDILEPRKRIAEFASQHELPVFSSLKQAIRWAERKTTEYEGQQ